MAKKFIFHDLASNPNQYERVYWPVKTPKGVECMACIQRGHIYTHMNTTRFEVISIRKSDLINEDGTPKHLPIVEYRMNDQHYTLKASAWWFAYNVIANTKN